MKLSSILGLNARFQLYSYPGNTQRAKRVASSKLLAKKVLRQAGIPVPDTYARFSNPLRLNEFTGQKLPDSFALKPSRGLGGEGIIVVKKRSRDSTPNEPNWITTQRRRITVEDLKLHILDIIEGAYSVRNVPDSAFFEEYIARHKAFRRFAYRGTPDIRLIVFNKIPVMAMLRLPTRESGGRANLHQGAVGVGVDVATGITTHAVHHGEPIRLKPETKRKLHGIKIPFWDRILEIASLSQIASGLGYVGVDIVLHPEKGPMVLEINSEPGLEIQLANMTGLRNRLEKVEDLKVDSTQQAVKIAKALFASSFAARVKALEEGITRIDVFEKITIKGYSGERRSVEAKIDTGAWRSSMDKKLAQELGLLQPGNVLWTTKVRSSLGRLERPVVNITFWLKGKKINTTAGVSDRTKLKKPFIVGRRDLAGFVVVPQN